MTTTSSENGSTRRAPGFELEVSQNRFLSPRAAQVHAIVTVASSEAGAPLPGPAAPLERAEVILVDCSGSMSVPPTKMAAAIAATSAAIEAMRTGTWFAVVAGRFDTQMVYPGKPGMVPASAATKAAAQAAVALLVAEGGTAIGRWLEFARILLEARHGGIRHAVLLTDGKNEGESRQELDAVLDRCKGRVSCDARGIGDDYEPRELLHIADVLLGNAEAVREHSELAVDFRRLMESSMSNVVTDLRLQVRTAQDAQISFVKEVFPTERDLTPHGVARDARTVAYSTGAWGEGDREFHVCLAVSPQGRPRSEDLQAASVRLTAVMAGLPDGAALGPPAPVLVHWTDDVRLSSRYHPKVSFYSRQGDLSQAVRAGYEAYLGGDRAAAEEHWGCAVALAVTAGNEDILRRLGRVLDVDSAAAGKASLRESIDVVDAFSVLFGSTSRVAYQGGTELADEPVLSEPRPDETCDACGRISPGEAFFCARCGVRLRVDDEPAADDPAKEGRAT